MKAITPLWYAVYSVISTILQEIAIVAIVLWVLPDFNIHVPLWGLVILVVAFAVYAYVTYRLGRMALILKPMVAPETIIGNQGKVVRPLNPEGYVKIQGVLWKASCVESELEVGDEVVVVEIDRLKLIVCRKEGALRPPREDM